MKNKFKRPTGAKLSSLKDMRKEAEAKSNQGGGRPGFHNISDGRNVFKIAPPLDEMDTPLYPFRSTWLKCNLPKLDDDNNPIKGKFEIKNKRIFIANMHGNQDLRNLDKDPIELYIKYVYDAVNATTDNKDERKKLLYPISGWRTNGKWNPGIRPSTNYVGYVWDEQWKLGRIEFYPNIVKKMEELNLADEDPNEPIEVDCFSDPDSGVWVRVDKNKDDNNKTQYTVNKYQVDMSKIMKECKGNMAKAAEEFEEKNAAYIVSDEKIKDLYDQPRLKELYVDVYMKRDFDLAINGLKIFDEENGYEIFEDPAFLEELAEIEAIVPEKTNDAEDSDEVETKATIKKKGNKVEEVEQEDASGWGKMKCVKFLRAYIDDNYGDDVEVPELKVSELREWCNLALADEDLPFEEGTEEDNGEVESDPEPETQEDDSENDVDAQSSVNFKAMLEAKRRAASKKK